MSNECTRPVSGFRQINGKIKPNELMSKLGPGDAFLTVRCGQCMNCRLERSRQWAVRIMHESKSWETSSFLTLTYRDEDLPLVDQADGSIGATLCVRDWQLFAKRLRHSLGKMSYFHCGEYGEKFGRPHYHAAVFGHDFREDRYFEKMSVPGSFSKLEASPLYRSDKLEELWSLGRCYIGELTFESAGYIARYCTKKLTGKRASEYGHRRPPYCSMSRNPAVGKKWFTEFHRDVYPYDEVIVNGVRQRPPKYYDRLMELQDPEMWGLIKQRRIERGDKIPLSEKQVWRNDVKDALANGRGTRLERTFDV